METIFIWGLKYIWGSGLYLELYYGAWGTKSKTTVFLFVVTKKHASTSAAVLLVDFSGAPWHKWIKYLRLWIHMQHLLARSVDRWIWSFCRRCQKTQNRYLNVLNHFISTEKQLSLNYQLLFIRQTDTHTDYQLRAPSTHTAHHLSASIPLLHFQMLW